eukprot:888358-Pyramimonas_sp.AAC.1
MILDGLSLCRQLRHRSGDIFNSASTHHEYKMNKGGQIVNANAGQLCAEYMTKTAKLAALFFCQPSGGSAARSGNVPGATRADGYAQQGATINELVMYWQNWAPSIGDIPVSLLNACNLQQL